VGYIINFIYRKEYNICLMLYLIDLLIIGILENIVDGIQRPLQSIAAVSGSVFVPKGVDVPALDEKKTWEFFPSKSLKIGGMVTGGDVIGHCFENNLFSEHRILVPPRMKGRITSIVPEGKYDVVTPLVEIELDGKTHKISMSHWWPVRQSRPVAEKLAGNVPLLTGQRVLDALFPSVLGYY
jgi:V-type H+-transporting ATPase subunit A